MAMVIMLSAILLLTFLWHGYLAHYPEQDEKADALDMNQLKEELVIMITNVYAPRSVEAFNFERQKWVDRMSSASYSALFGSADITMLTPHDLNRTIAHHYITLGPAELSSEGTNVILASFSVTNLRASTMYCIEIEFGINDNGEITILAIILDH